MMTPPARRPLFPYEYETLWRIVQDGPLTAGELAETRNRKNASHDVRFTWTAQGMANQLRPLVRRGWLHRRDDGTYELTDRAREAISW